MSEEQLKQLYMKIDANSKGEIGFDDFTSYLLLQQLAKENEPAAEHTTFVRVTTFGSKMYGRCDYEDSESAPSDEEERTADDELWFNPEPVKKEYNDKIGLPRNIIEKIMLLGSLNVYVSSSQEGMLKIWSADNLKPLRTITNGSGAWITDMVVMAQQPMAVFALDRRRVLFRSAEGRMSFDCLGRITALENAPMCATWLRVAENDKLLFGDELGILHTYTFNDEWGGERPREVFGVSDKKLPPGMSENTPWMLHNDWMTSIKYLSHSNSLITTGMDSQLLMLDFEKRQIKWSGNEHANGIYACDYCRSYNFIVTCGLERYINIWNPFTAKTMGYLHGHEASVMDVQVNEIDNQIVSMSTDSQIKVWDMRSSRCLETIIENTQREPTRATIYYDSQKEVLLAGGDMLEMWHKRRAREARTAEIAAMIYNPLFRQVVVGEVDSLVMVWDLDTGEDIFTFSDTHRKSKITCMAFDHSLRRLLIGAQDGSLRFWNFNNGQVLKEFVGFGQGAEITCCLCMNVSRLNYVAAGGWNKKVCLWSDTVWVATENIEKNMRGHVDDVTCVCFCAPSTFVTGGCDSKVIVWKMDGVIMRILKPSDHEQTEHDYKVIRGIIFLKDLVRTIVVSVADGWLRFWRLQDGELVHELFADNNGGTGPIAADLKCTMLFSADAKGYVKVWDLTHCHFARKDIEPTKTPLLFDFRAHHEPIVSLCFVDNDNLILTCSKYGTVRLWNSVGARIGQFGQHSLWNVKFPTTWKTREPSYLIQPLIRQDPDGVFSTARTPVRTTNREFRLSITKATSSYTEEDETSESRDEAEILSKVQEEEKLKRLYEAKKKAVLDPGPPHLRLESWYTPLLNAYERQLAIKKLSPLLPLLPEGLSEIAKEKAHIVAAERSASPLSVTSTRSKKKKGRSTPAAPHSKHELPIDPDQRSLFQ
nr:WD repeat-containing protein on Y chromosome-like isoform X4 [Physcomitrium patens]|eukprot:XP_024383322.1 WD repeat-containing protein on Y chromosome-like isoform X4 [Physcomitrella patens]